MKVLVTGGYRFIGWSTAIRFYKEGYAVHILNDENGVPRDKNIPHKTYNYKFTSSKYDKIFEINNFDVVVHIPNMHNKKKNHLAELQYILELSSKYDVKKFIYISSVSLYKFNNEDIIDENHELNPMSCYGINLLSMEQYCKFWNETHDIQVCSLRISSVYGAGYSVHDEQNIIGNLIAKNIKKGSIEIENTIDIKENNLKDYIYVDDLVDAIYKSVEFCKSFALNITSYSLSDGANIENEIVNIIDGNKEGVRKNKGIMIRKQGYSNKQAISELNWVPRYSLHNGIEKTYQWIVGEGIKEKVVEKKKESNVLNSLKKVIPYIENILALILVIIISNLLTNMHVIPVIDLKIIYIALIAIVYGLNQSIISIVLASIYYIYTMLLQGHNIVALLYNPNTLLTISIYIFVGTVLGYLLDSKDDEITYKEEELKILKEKFDFIYGMYNEVKDVKNALEYQIQTSEDSFGKIYKITSALDTLRPDKIFSEAINVIEDLTQNKSIAIFVLSKNKSFLRLASVSSNIVNKVQKSINIENYRQIKDSISNNEIYINKSMDRDLPEMICPISVDNNIIAVIAVYEMEFEDNTLYKQNLFRTLSSLIASALLKAQVYDEAIYNKKYWNDNGVLKFEYFLEVVYEKEQRKQEKKGEYTILEVKDQSNAATEKIITKNIRDIDYISKSNDGDMYILLSNTSEDESMFVKNRLIKNGISAGIVTYEHITRENKNKKIGDEE